MKALEELAPDRYPPMDERRLQYERPGNVEVRSHDLILAKPGLDPKARAEAN